MSAQLGLCSQPQRCATRHHQTSHFPPRKPPRLHHRQCCQPPTTLPSFSSQVAKLRFPHLADSSAMDFSDIFRMVNFAVAVFVVLGGIAKLFPFNDFSHIILGIYLIIFGLGNALLEFQIPQQVARYASFMFSFLGRGIFYIFIGSVIVGERWFRIVPGTIVGIIGVAYAALEFIPSIEPPANMRDADAGWGAEQV
ncbi:hypothetical protein LEMA_P033700.1 [Plenodomus lingam JN3]|uniref:COPI-coated vesicle protein n=2 Tax=Leptosphaeria maculans TaxID=5022 RepID=E4ZR31_LEPMJ|nr:hypothetical protein LEMA_P033700.1 [Plenodomus lingam JN3]CBX93696.1 hypothetical protein LEMA_P033700.1 [Plenodomus lingam JN3]